MQRFHGRCLSALIVIPAAFLAAGCQNGLKSSGPYVRVQSLSATVGWASSKPSLASLAKGGTGFQVKEDDLLRLVTEVKHPPAGYGPSGTATLVVINKQTNETNFWTLTDNVKAIRLASEVQSGVQLKTVGQVPLRLELWCDRPGTFPLIVEMK
jgi:hypothetical protein